MDDPDSGRNESESFESLLAPFQELVALAIAFEFHFHVQAQRFCRAGEIDLHRVIDHEIDWHERFDDFRIAAQFLHRASHRGEIYDQRNAGEILQDDARDHEWDFLVRGRFRIPICERLDILPPDLFSIAISQDRFEDDANADRQPRDFPDALLLERGQGMKKSTAAVTGVEFLQRFKFVRHDETGLTRFTGLRRDFLPIPFNPANPVQNYFSSASVALILSKFGSSRASSLLSAY